MAKNKAPLIPITKNIAPPVNSQGPTIVDWVNEGHARIRQENANGVFLGSLLDRLLDEIIKRDQKISELEKPKE